MGDDVVAPWKVCVHRDARHQLAVEVGVLDVDKLLSSALKAPGPLLPLRACINAGYIWIVI